MQRAFYREHYRPDFGNIVCLHSGSRVWYGSRQNTKEYELFVFIPSGQAFMARNVVCGGYVLLAVFALYVFVLCKNHTEKENLEQEHKRLQIIDALGLAYSLHFPWWTWGQRPLRVLKGAEQVNELIVDHTAKLTWNLRIWLRLQRNWMVMLRCPLQPRRKKGAWLLTLIVPQNGTGRGQITAVLGRSARCDGGAGKGREQDQALRSALAAAEHANRAKDGIPEQYVPRYPHTDECHHRFTALAAAHQ